MSPSTEATEEQREFAANVLRNLLRHIEAKNREDGSYRFLISHAWTEGAMMYVVYTAPPSDITWGLVRDTRESIINPSPWTDADEAVLYYYLVDFEEDWPGQLSRQPDEPDTIQWSGHDVNGLPELLPEIPEEHRYTAPPEMPAEAPTDKRSTIVNEPRRYADPM